MIKKSDIEKNYTRDLAACASTYLLIKRCPGGRPIVEGYICPHCGNDTSYGDCGGVHDFVNQHGQKR